MDIEDYDKKMELAFDCGEGGLYAKENYDSAIRESKTLEGFVDDLIHDIKIDPEGYSHLIPIKRPTSDEGRVEFIEAFIRQEFGFDKCGSPEICGTVAGIMFRDGEREKVLEFLEIDDMDEPRYWDS
jgi:hypothetical protein